jgi:hypothetical protein
MTLVMKAALVCVAMLAAACVEDLPGLEGTSSLRVELLDPVDPGAVDRRIPDGTRAITVKVSAIDTHNQLDAAFTATVQVHVQFLGSITPELGARQPLATVEVVAGVSQPTVIELPAVFGPTVLWIEDGARADATFATGTSPTLWFRDPHIADISTPENPMGLDALVASPLELKQVAVSSSRHGALGRLVVTSTYSQGYTVSDVKCADEAGTPPCTTEDFDHILIFTFGRPVAVGGRTILVGDSVARFTGGVQEFNGLTELGFPQTFLSPEPTRPERVPPPRLVDTSWFSSLIEFEKVESFLIRIDGATVCPVDDDYATYKQWKLDLGQGCGRQAINVITAGVIDFDPVANEGARLTSVVGALRPVNIGSFNVWIIYPRSPADLVAGPTLAP